MKKSKPTPAATPYTYPDLHDYAGMVGRVEEGLPVPDLVAFGREAGFTHR